MNHTKKIYYSKYQAKTEKTWSLKYKEEIKPLNNVVISLCIIYCDIFYFKKQGTKVLIFYLIFTKLSFSFNHVTLHQCQWKLKKQLHRHLHVIRIKRDIDSEIEFISTYSIHVRDFTAIWPSIEMLLKWPSLLPDGCNFW